MSPNRLAAEKSLYLRQHALNPVEWYPWGEEAFHRAQQEDKPIFLSIGYSTCHWCHVMARESFADPEIGARMNDVFLSIKVDREERPDIDSLYMAVCQMMTGSGGWPLTIIMTPEKKPFFAATYLPRTSRDGHVGMRELIARVAGLWADRRPDLDRSADEVINRLKEVSAPATGREPDEASCERAFQELSIRYDEEHGGFGTAPKFPTPHVLTFLLRYSKRTGNEKALHMALATLRAMRRGGIYDHLGFGFHRYSTDEQWLVPHFEKMLYDQALLTLAYLEGYLASGRPLFRQTAEEILAYMLRDLADPQGGFYAAEDADSQGMEGAFYVWRDDEMRRILPPSDADLAALVFGLNHEGQLHDPTSAEGNGANILHLDLSVDDVAARLGQPEDLVRMRLETIRERLFLERRKRPRPSRDEKILADWNGLAIAALAAGGRILERGDFVEAAEKAAEFISRTMLDEQNGLCHRYVEGEVAVSGFLDDYAFLAWGMLELYETTALTKYLKTAVLLTERTIHDFWDERGGGFFFAGADAEQLHVRRKEIYDGAMPSGNSVSAMNLVRLGRMLGRPEYEQRALAVMRAFAAEIEQMPSAHAHLMSTRQWMAGPSAEVVIVGDPASKKSRLMRQALFSRYHPHIVVVQRPQGPDAGEIGMLAEYVRPMAAIGDETTAYICRNQQCAGPTTDVLQMLRSLG